MSQTNAFHYRSRLTTEMVDTVKHRPCSTEHKNSGKTMIHYSTDSHRPICHGEMIACNTCPGTSGDPPLTKEKIILPFSFDPKKNLQFNGLKKNHSTLGQIKLSTASNGQSLIRPSGEIKVRATTNTCSKSKQTSASNLKRKRLNSSSPPPTLIHSPNTQLAVLHRLFLSCQPEEFHGPSFSFNQRLQKSCFICRKSSIKQGPSIHCDYCPLTYHLDCLTAPINSFPLFNEKWMCPNHLTPNFDRCLTRKSTFFTSDRVKIFHRHSSIEENIIRQDFTHHKPTKLINHQQFQPIHTSEIPQSIEEFYSKANIALKSIGEYSANAKKDRSEEPPSPIQSSSVYDPSIWDTLQAILTTIVTDQPYEFSLVIESEKPIRTVINNPSNTMERLLQALNEPDRITDLNENPILPTFSHLIDLGQFRLSHAALIHLQSKEVLYIRKHVIWFGSSLSNDICFEKFDSSRTCRCTSERHACLYYDQKRNLFELLNYSEYGTIVNDLQYGIGSITNDDDDDEDLHRCFCGRKSFSQSSWDGSASIEQGTVIKIGCHEFLFYRHIVR